MDDLDPTLREGPYPLQAHLGFELTGWREGWARVELPVRSIWATGRDWCMAAFTRRCWTRRWGIAAASPATGIGGSWR
jgi:hypothetical protein